MHLFPSEGFIPQTSRYLSGKLAIIVIGSLLWVLSLMVSEEV